uniref:Galectin 4 n=1 Tax=Cyprinus carpio carpio TaxID=630221 RepID=A0A9J8A4V4_CYPCA
MLIFLCLLQNLPYVAPISGGLREGMALYLKGVIPTNADQFEINFKTGQSDSDDTAFHFNPRLHQKVVMNSFRNRKWEAKESVSDNPFKKGETFEMFTVIKSEGYQVYVNGKELYTFKHRITLEKVSTLNISGHVVVSLFGFMQNWSASSFPTTFTSLSRSHGELSTRQSEILQPVQNPNLPYVAPISGGLREGMAFYLKGVIPTNADQFEINFKTGQSDSDDTAFHFNPRLHQKVVMNSFRNRKWEAKESVSDNPFKKGETFEMFTVIKSEGYQVYVNGKELYTFKHRIPLKKVSTLNINGDVAVNLSGFLKNWSASVFPTKVITKITTLGSSHGGLSTVQSEILQPVRNPNLPYVAPISGGLREGMALYLQGVVPTNADQFEINFKTGQSSNDDMAFQFNPRMDQKVAINSVINGSWGTEESVSDNPFKKGEAFEMFTVIKSEGYQVYVNGKELYTFKHRIPLEKVSTLNISGDVAVNLSEILQPVQNPNLPYVAPISGGLREGMALYLQGVVPTNADQFEINFKTGPSSNDDMAFQFNPRMDQKVAMNSVINGSWGTEESVSDNPFKKGEAFEMFSVIKSEGFQVYVNGKELYTFKHRIPLEKVSTLNINGDVAVNLSGFLQNWSASVSPTEVITKITTLGSSHGVHSTVQSKILQPVQNPNLPYVAPISGGLREGMALYLKGVVPTNADQFEINFKTGPSSNDDMAFQFNPRMDQKVAMNSVINGSWGTEESVSDNPFKKGEAFEMFSVIKSEGFQVYVNGKELYTFKHRIPLEKVSTLNINGDVAVNLSEILQPVQNPNLPYVAPISGGLREGMALYLQGVVPTDADQFEINFKTGPSSNDDMAFQFKPRMDQKVAMNSIINGSWGTEESLGPCPHMGCVASIHQVYVNGKELYTFKHRIPLEKVSTLNISGDVAVNLSGFLQNWSASVFPTEVTTKITTLGTSHGGVSTVQSEILQPVQNPNLPYVAPISGGLREGMALYLQGVVPTNADQFEINFKTGPSSNDDMAFQFNPRMDQKVAMNSVINGSWGTEESVSDNPFKKGEAFEMFSVIKSEGFQVYVNGKELYTFKHRIPLEKVSTLNISGDVAVNLSEILQPVQNPNLPYVAPISGGLREGMALYLQGVVPTNADQFVINFKTGQSSNEDKAFHFNPRMDKKVAMNSVINGIWGTEESVSENPFKKGEAFEMFSVIKSEGYQVYVNGKEMYTFKHRIPLEKVSTLNISGDVAVKLSGFIQNWSASVFPTEVITKITTLGSSHGAHSTVQSEILQPVQNPNLPYVAPISGGLREGMALYLKGVVPTNADQFEINFKTGPSSNDDMAFQFKPRMDQKLAMNSIINGSWGTEESVSDNPFKKGEAFEMFTVIKSEGYQVYVNGKELYTFKHRIPLEKVSTLNINGDVAVNLSEILQPVQNPNLPYVAPISGGLREGMALYLQGVVPTNADQFEINFKTGPSSNDDMAFQFNPRMDQKVAMNSVINGSWGTEESVSDNPFKKGEAFEMFSVIKSEGFQVYVNGKELYTFKHRIPLEKVSTLNINGDVAVNLSGVLQNWSASVSPTEVITKITTMCSSHGAHSTVQSEILQPVQNPNLPYVAPISGGLREGMALYLQGVVPTNADQFEINFKTGPSSNDDMAFQFNPRMDQKVAMNSVINGSWGTEESTHCTPKRKLGACPHMGCVSSIHQVYVNGKELYTFQAPYTTGKKVSTLNINGDVAVNLSEILQPVQNPNLPYVAPISGGLREGMALYLQGVVPTNADQFEINFKTGPSSNDDMAFQFNPRMDQKVAMNSVINGSWGTEESVSENPFNKGEAFEMLSVIKSEGFQVYVNGKELYTFKHRIPLEKVSTLNINGDVAVNLSGFLQNWSASVSPTEVITKITTLGSSHGAHSTVQSEILQPVQNPNLPYVAPISGGLREGMALYLQGVVPTNADQFEINFKTGPSSNDDMAFQFNPRMDQKVAMNSVINGSWGTEESVSENPFNKGRSTCLYFETQHTTKRKLGPCPHMGCVASIHQVYVNGKELYTFKHRIPLEKVSTLNISGDVAVNLSGFLQNWSASVFPTEVITKITTLGSSHGAHSTVQSEILQPVRNPNLPYVAPISGGLREGMALYLKGVVPTNADQFEINFKTGPSSNDDMAFQFHPRMDQKLAMNSIINGSWGTEESVSDNPFKKGEAFEMFTVIKSEGYQVYVNGKELYTFKHRIPLEKVSTLNINGDVAVNLSGFLQNWSASVFPTEVITKITTLGSSHGGVSTVQSEILQPVQNPNLPYVAPISGGLREGMALYLQGVVPTNADQFEINFKTGPSSNDDMAFQFNPRMDQKLAMNSIINGSWGTEESVSDNPFKKGEAFEMFTVIKSEGYQVYVNGKELYTFKHRIPLEKVSTLNISGDVAVNLSGFIQNWSASVFPTEVITKITTLGSTHGAHSTVQSEILQPVQNPNLPYVAPISGGLREGMALYLKGVVPTNADQFEINFKTGPSSNDDMAFQFNPRMDQKLAMNSIINGSWGTEESVSDNPFKKGEAFEMFSVIKSEGYQVKLYTFKHRIPLEKVSTLNFSGDVAVNLSGFLQVGHFFFS